MSSAPESILFFYEIDIVLDYIYKIIWYFALCAWVISLNVVVTSSICDVTNNMILSFLMAE